MKYRAFQIQLPEDLTGLDLESRSRLSDFPPLSSGFDDLGYALPGEDGLSMQSLHDAMMEALRLGREGTVARKWGLADEPRM